LATRISINGGWLYLSPGEEKNLINCIKLLENARSHDGRLHSGAFRKALRLSKSSTAHSLGICVSARLMRPNQYGRMRLYSLIKGYRKRLKDITRRIGKEALNRDS